MSQDIENLLGMSAIGFGLGVAGTVLSVLWLRTTEGEWPDRDQITVLAKVFFGIAAFGVVLAYLFMKYA
jgi:hypothetical protein